METLKKYPFFILTYQRPNHLQQVIDALLKDPSSGQYEYYFFIDGLKSKATDHQRKNQQEIIAIIENFKNSHTVYMHLAKENQGVFESLLWGAKTILQDHEGFIYLEEDIIPKLGFVDYMQTALNHYRQFDHIYAINGFAFKEIKHLIQGDSYVASRFCPWGFATFKHIWEETDWSLKSIKYKKWNPFFWIHFNQNTWGWGWTFFFYVFIPFLRPKIQPWDILFCLHHYLKGHYSVWLKDSLVYNNGLDYSGLHAGITLQQENESEEGLKYNDSCFIDKIDVNLKQNRRISRFISPLFRAKSFKTGFNMFRTLICKKKKEQ